MKTLFYTTSLTLMLFSTSCVKKQQPPKIEETPSVDMYEDALTQGEQTDVRKERQSVKVVNPSDFNKLQKYSVIVATLSKRKGVDALKSFFERDGIDHFVVQNTANGLYYFVIHSSDSEREAIKARADFLTENVVHKSKEEIWSQYYIYMVDTFILEKE